jgi:two-component system chemotaxis sensor kinase CheA
VLQVTSVRIPAAVLQTFVDELDERVADMERDLLALERPAADSVHAEEVRSLFRAAHSLKGAARAIGLPEIETVCHELESRLAPVRSSGGIPDASLIELLLASRDALADAGVRLRAGTSLDDAPITSVLRAAPGGQPRRRVPVVTLTTPATEGREKVPSPAAPTGETDAVVRVRAKALDRLLTDSGEVFVQRSRLNARLRALADVEELLAAWQSRRRAQRARVSATRDGTVDAALAELAALGAQRSGALRESAKELERASLDLEDDLRVARMQPFAQVCDGFDRAVRDLARDQAKEVRLVMEGGEVEVDREIGRQAREALLHLVRNAIDHGIEPPAHRAARGKAPQATVRLAAALVGSHVALSVSDDGRGLDETAIRSRAEQLGLPTATDRRGIVSIVTAAGFSTKRDVSEISGRGVGLDVVVAIAESLRGTFELDWEAGQGSRCTLLLPLTLATLRAIVVRARGALFALPTSDVRHIVRASPDRIRIAEGHEMLLLEDRPVRLARLGEVLHLPEDTTPRATAALILAVVVHAPAGELAFVVDDALVEQEVVVRSLGRGFAGVALVSGATVLESGEVAPILATNELVRTALATSRVVLGTTSSGVKALRRVLVVDDSATTRSLVRSILEVGGYAVQVAVDGADALARIQRDPPEVIVSDVEMPRMDGFALCAAVRAVPSLRAVPFILVTSLGSDVDRARGLDAGADAYIVKGEFEQGTLLDAVGRLVQ